MHAAMVAHYANMKLPITSSISLGVDFGQQIECGDDYNAEAISEALQSLGFAVNMTPA
jgi:hypothetical protein